MHAGWSARVAVIVSRLPGSTHAACHCARLPGNWSTPGKALTPPATFLHTQALEKYNIEKDIASYIKKEVRAVPALVWVAVCSSH